MIFRTANEAAKIVFFWVTRLHGYMVRWLRVTDINHKP
jgi:hypothetical protein